MGCNNTKVDNVASVGGDVGRDASGPARSASFIPPPAPPASSAATGIKQTGSTVSSERSLGVGKKKASVRSVQSDGTNGGGSSTLPGMVRTASNVGSGASSSPRGDRAGSPHHRYVRNDSLKDSKTNFLSKDGGDDGSGNINMSVAHPQAHEHDDFPNTMTTEKTASQLQQQLSITSRTTTAEGILSLESTRSGSFGTDGTMPIYVSTQRPRNNSQSTTSMPSAPSTLAGSTNQQRLSIASGQSSVWEGCTTTASQVRVHMNRGSNASLYEPQQHTGTTNSSHVTSPTTPPSADVKLSTPTSTTPPTQSPTTDQSNLVLTPSGDTVASFDLPMFQPLVIPCNVTEICYVCRNEIEGEPFYCLTCDHFVVCDVCLVDGAGDHDTSHNFDTAAARANLSPLVIPTPDMMPLSASALGGSHVMRCQQCEVNLLVVRAFSCDMCPGYQLCEACFVSQSNGHDPTHTFTETECLLTPRSASLTSRFGTPQGQSLNSACDLMSPLSLCSSTRTDAAVVSTPTSSAFPTSPSKRGRPRRLTTTSSHAVKGSDTDGNKTLNLYTVYDTIGSGTSGKVKLARHLQTKQTYAIKILKRSLARRRAKRGGEEALRREVAIMKKLDHPNIVKLHEVIDDPKCEKLYLIMEHVPAGPVFVLGRDAPMHPERIRAYAAHMCYGLQYLHANGIVHRDIKPDNILVDDDDVVKLTDFGVSAPMEEADRGTTLEGTPAFMAPEMLRLDGGSFNGVATDMWALGVTLYAMTYGHLPFAGTSLYELRDTVGVEDPPYAPPCGDADLEDLVRRLLSVDPSQRPDVEHAMQHPFLAPVVLGIQQQMMMLSSYGGSILSNTSVSTNASFTGAMLVGSQVTLRNIVQTGLYIL
eukprot:PhM_4_TR10465/c0_g1_i2/m.12749/K07359/CAMKK2; calcium/calmodulin-dependent protein kinase kinase 2